MPIFFEHPVNQVGSAFTFDVVEDTTGSSRLFWSGPTGLTEVARNASTSTIL